MSLRVFISYSGHDDQLIALRVQTLAAVYGSEVYVPPANTRVGAGNLGAGSRQQIDTSDLVLAVVNSQPSAASIAELNYAMAQNKMVIPIIGQWVNSSFLSQFPNRFILNPANPGLVEQQIMEFLQQTQANKETKQLILGVAAVVVGLLLLSAVSE